MEDEFPPDVVRAPAEVARRALALFATIGLAFGTERAALLQWLTDNDLWTALSPRERGFVDTTTPSRRQIANASWNSECLCVLLWALQLIKTLPAPNEQCDTSVFQNLLPPYAGATVKGFVERAALRPQDELIAMADEILGLHWEARDAKLNARESRLPVDIEIIQERHRAINWVIGYDGAGWDDVTTDT